MKKITTLAVTAASLLLAAPLLTAVTTDPVGAQKHTFKDGSDTAISAPLHSSAAFVGVVGTSGLSGFTITPSGTPGWAANQFTDSPHYIIFTSGTREGLFYTVTANTTDSITVEDIGDGDLATQGIVDGDGFTVIPFWTLNTLFPDGEGFIVSSDVFNPDGVIFFTNSGTSGVNLPFDSSYLYHDGSQGAAGWYKVGSLGDGLQNDLPLPPDAYYVVRNNSGADVEMVLAGSVQMANFATIVSRLEDGSSQDVFIANSFPVATTLAESGLATSPAFTPSPDVFNPLDVVFVFDNDTVGINKPLGSSYLYHDGSQGAAGWYQIGNLGAGLQDDVEVFQPGQGFVIRKAAGLAESEIWMAQAPYLDNS
ncbi:TIGR02597 family protein [Rubellicoccus peritrichatus]|uniref:TIGR02597 family protein n=1 Tax=Rubellicoccus peritrichatus TaxID=3080537 RepID=A0AAQ3QVC2_9BACT|nr:TIGR02597 family protein [Puniceicoccus sp. CR14]WOO40725.1 TIGR02597 family protein [Puniceicoccus sp. CR14]